MIYRSAVSAAVAGGSGSLARCCFSSTAVNNTNLVSSTALNNTDLESKIASLEEQVQQQTKLMKLQSQMLVDLTDSLKHNGNLLERYSEEHGTCPDARDRFVPTIDMVVNQVNHTCQLDNDTLATLAINGDGFARRERILREIMQVDRCSWDEAHEKLIEMDVFNERCYWLETAPYRLGVAVAAVCFVGSFLLVFHKPTARFYAEKVAGEEIPEDKDISTMTTNQVGAWTWEWMEPMIGVASFAILCLQFGRSQMLNMRMSAYTKWMLKKRGDRAAAQYPQYTGAIVRAWSVVLPSVDHTFFPRYKRELLSVENRKVNYRSGA
jgi:hypothetical protein